MNILICSPSGLVRFRPDTSLNRDGEDYCVPDFQGDRLMEAMPLLFTRASRAGKVVQAKFASRYMGSIGFGLALRPASGGPLADILDFSTVLSSTLFNPLTLTSDTSNDFVLWIDEKEVFRFTTACGCLSLLEDSIVQSSLYSSFRIGDMICRELSDAGFPLKGEELSVKATFCGNNILDFKIKY